MPRHSSPNTLFQDSTSTTLSLHTYFLLDLLRLRQVVAMPVSIQSVTIALRDAGAVEQEHRTFSVSDAVNITVVLNAPKESNAPEEQGNETEVEVTTTDASQINIGPGPYAFGYYETLYDLYFAEAGWGDCAECRNVAKDFTPNSGKPFRCEQCMINDPQPWDLDVDGLSIGTSDSN
ncbi:hypothetical protein PANT_9c00013 [Moesziomyces antarcticus T-34]|uniref:Uncharacterized protein n=1 Tax=Pseudozyma antarctica (strain T-34) TaxID=1151754 RepID=M9LUW0_PSEA3|nr:hypothetical protein PANT_9c00013 [Moesziomyces antarcticus T-34]